MERCHFLGCVLGTAVGDAIGLPYEGVPRNRLQRLLGPPDRHRFLFGRGMISDDTEHTCIVVQSLIASGGDSEVFKRELAVRLRWWLATLPAGIGRATLLSCVKLWLGVSPDRSGVFSAGNGPAMRSAILGVWFNDTKKMVLFVQASARMTHSDPKAEFGSIAVALAANMNCRQTAISGERFLVELAELLGENGSELMAILRPVVDSVAAGESTQQYALEMGLDWGVSGYTYHTVPIAIHAWLSHPQDYRAAVMSAIECGGDADTTAAIVGAIVGAAVGEAGIPRQWLAGIFEWPRSIAWMRRLVKQLVETRDMQTSSHPVSNNFFVAVGRNMFFLSVVLFHGFRRLLPPY